MAKGQNEQIFVHELAFFTIIRLVSMQYSANVTTALYFILKKIALYFFTDYQYILL